MQQLKSPHKLTEVELYRTLQQIVELPETKLKQMLTTKQPDEHFILHLAKRVPQFLTPTLVNITQTLLL
jgi:hypothetical protein